jgi:hypothetical protein
MGHAVKTIEWIASVNIAQMGGHQAGTAALASVVDREHDGVWLVVGTDTWKHGVIDPAATAINKSSIRWGGGYLQRGMNCGWRHAVWWCCRWDGHEGHWRFRLSARGE